MKYILGLLLITNLVHAQISGGTQDVNILSGSVTLLGPSSVSQSGAWGVTLLAGTNSIGSITNTAFGATQSGVWNVGLSTGSNVIGSIANTGFNISGTLPAFASTPTVNIGTGAYIDRVLSSAPYSNRLSDGTSFYDARAIRALTSSDEITIANASLPVTGTFFQATQPVSIATLPSLATGTNTIGAISNTSFNVGNFPATQAISASSLPLPIDAATSSEQQTQTATLQTLDNVIGSVSPGVAGSSSQLVGGVYNSTRPLPVLTTGQQIAYQIDERGRPYKAVSNGRYSYSVVSGTNAAGFNAQGTANTDIFRIVGSATKTVYVRKIRMAATATALQGNQVAIIKRSTVNTGGTAVAEQVVPNDSNYPAATCTVNSYTAAPTALGTSVGELRVAKFLIPTTTTVFNPEIVFEPSENESEPWVLRGANQQISILIKTAPGGGNNFLISAEIEEE